jgi:hypothetical protein
MDSTSLTQHYLAVQALTPQSGSPISTTGPVSSGFDLPFGLSLFQSLVIIGLVVIGLVILFIVVFQDVKKAFTIIGLILMTSAVPISVAITNQQTRIQSQAGPNYVPKNVSVNQVISNGFTVVWDTDQPGVGVIRVRPQSQMANNNQIFSEAEDGDIYKHIIKISQLKPNQDYYFEILSGGVWYDDQGQPLHVQTLQP